MASVDADVQRSLQETLGVTISMDWWQACCHFLSSDPTLPNADTAMTDAVLMQILHADLRDIVRPNSNSSYNDEVSSSSLSSSQRLQDAIRQSSQLNAPKQILPKEFQLLCQVEDWVDVSLGKEARLANGGINGIISNTSRGNNYNAKTSRCFKLFLTDGLVKMPILAMETLPLESSQKLQPGCKLILKGDIVVRWGMLQLHSGNATIIGGVVEEIAAKRQRALEQSQKEVGVGVDPTIRALIGTNGITDEDEEVDEGEGESSDIVPQPPAPRARQSNAPAMNLEQNMPMPDASSTTRTPSIPHIPRESLTSSITAMARQNNLNVLRSTSIEDNTQTNDSDATATSSPYTGSNAASAQFRVPQNSQLNPYANQRKKPSSTSASSLTSTSNPYVNNTTPSSMFQTAAETSPFCESRQSAGLVEPVAQIGMENAGAETAPTGSRPIKPSVSPSVQPIPFQVGGSLSQISTTNSARRISSVMKDNPYSSALTANDFRDHHIHQGLSPQNVLESIRFADLHTLLKQVISNPAAYQNHMSKVWKVRMKQKGSSVHFNIGKKNKMKDKSKKYFFEIHAAFGQDSTDDSVLVCKLPSNLIEPYFQKSPAELRALSRTDRQASQLIVETGGKQVKDAYFDEFRDWKATLYQPVDQISASMSFQDVQKPILLIEPTT